MSLEWWLICDWQEMQPFGGLNVIYEKCSLYSIFTSFHTLRVQSKMTWEWVGSGLSLYQTARVWPICWAAHTHIIVGGGGYEAVLIKRPLQLLPTGWTVKNVFSRHDGAAEERRGFSCQLIFIVFCSLLLHLKWGRSEALSQHRVVTGADGGFVAVTDYHLPRCVHSPAHMWAWSGEFASGVFLCVLFPLPPILEYI